MMMLMMMMMIMMMMMMLLKEMTTEVFGGRSSTWTDLLPSSLFVITSVVWVGQVEGRATHFSSIRCDRFASSIGFTFFAFATLHSPPPTPPAPHGPAPDGWIRLTDDWWIDWWLFFFSLEIKSSRWFAVRCIANLCKRFVSSFDWFYNTHRHTHTHTIFPVFPFVLSLKRTNNLGLPRRRRKKHPTSWKIIHLICVSLSLSLFLSFFLSFLLSFIESCILTVACWRNIFAITRHCLSNLSQKSCYSLLFK